jgi:hypothetical protein
MAKRPICAGLLDPGIRGATPPKLRNPIVCLEFMIIEVADQ